MADDLDILKRKIGTSTSSEFWKNECNRAQKLTSPPSNHVTIIDLNVLDSTINKEVGMDDANHSCLQTWEIGGSKKEDKVQRLEIGPMLSSSKCPQSPNYLLLLLS